MSSSWIDRGALGRVRGVLQDHPIAGAVTYTVVGALPLYLMSAQAPRLQAQLGFGKTELGYIVASFFLVSSIASRASGRSVDRMGAGKAMRRAAMLSLASLLFIVFLAFHWVLLAVFLGVSGLANAYGQLGSNLAVADQVRKNRQGVGFGLKQAAVPIAALLSGLIVPFAIDLSWRLPFALGCLGVLVALLIVPNYPITDLNPDTVGNPSPVSMTAPLLLLAFAAAVSAGLGNSLATFVVDASVTQGFADSTAARLLTVGSAIAIMTRIASGWVIDRRRSGGTAELLTLLAVGALGFLILGGSESLPFLFVLGVVVGFAGAWGWVGVMQYTATRSSHLRPGLATGWVLAGGYLGTVVLPPVVGWFAENAGYGPVFLAASGLTLVSAAAVASSRVLWERRRRST